MTKTAIFALGVIAAGLSLAAPRGETTTYVDGNIANLRPNTGGTLEFSDKDAMMFKSSVAEVAVPYMGIQKAELGAAQTHSSDEPLYKVWALHRRIHKTQT